MGKTISPLTNPTASMTPPKRRSLWRRVLRRIAMFIPVYLIVAYLVMPGLWKRYVRSHPSLEDIPGITHTKSGMPGDPLNVALIGTRPQVMKIMVAAHWYPADPLTFRSCLEIAEASVLKRPYDAAPVSDLYLWGRKQDLAFENPVGDNPRKRHHVRFWKSDKVDPDGRPVWVGSAVYDERVGLSRRTGQVTHVTAPDVDAERDKLFHDLKQTDDLAEEFIVQGFHQIRSGKNGGGDPWHTDGDLYGGVIRTRIGTFTKHSLPAVLMFRHCLGGLQTQGICNATVSNDVVLERHCPHRLVCLRGPGGSEGGEVHQRMERLGGGRKPPEEGP